MTLRSYLLQKIQEKLQRINTNNEMCFTRYLAFHSLEHQFFGQWKQMIKEICCSILMNRKLVSPWPSTFVLNKYLKCFMVKACQARACLGWPHAVWPWFLIRIGVSLHIWLGRQREGQERSARTRSGSGQQPSLL